MRDDSLVVVFETQDEFSIRTEKNEEQNNMMEQQQQQNNQRTNQASCIVVRRTKNLMAHGVLEIATKFNINLSVLNIYREREREKNNKKYKTNIGTGSDFTRIHMQQYSWKIDSNQQQIKY